jgi:hypothetical protein
MTKARIRFPVIAAAVALAGAAHAGALDTIYDDQDIASLRPRYEQGWRNNYDNVFSKVFTDQERSRLAAVRFRMERRVPGNEPFGFMGGSNTVIASAASLRFLEEIALARTWLDRNGLATQSVSDYLLMLRYWDESKGRPPKPLEALCIPPNAWDIRDIADRATRAFDTETLFVLLHEYGHVFHGHPGNAAVRPEVSRANEEAADRFALDLLARVGEVPVGVALLFFTMTHLSEEVARTHPVSPDRLMSVARHLTTAARSFERGLRPGAQVTMLGIALEVSQLALLLGDPAVQRGFALIGRTVRPDDLAPRPKDRHLAAPCGSRASTGQPFDGKLTGTLTGGRTALDVDVVLSRNGDGVTGSYSFGVGFARLEGTIQGSTLNYRWRLASEIGAGRITLQGGQYRGIWGNEASSTDGGTILLRSNP